MASCVWLQTPSYMSLADSLWSLVSLKAYDKILWVWRSSSFINTICSVCVARALIMPCKVCKTWAVGHWYRFPMLYGVGRVLRFNRNGAPRSHDLRPSHFPVWGRVDFWGKFVEWVLLCSEECHNKYIQDPEAIIFESLVNMFLWSSHVWVSRICFHLICAINCDEHDPQGNDAAPRLLWLRWHVPHVSSLRAMDGGPWTFCAKAQWKRRCLDSWKRIVGASIASSFPFSSLGVCRLLGTVPVEDAVMLWWVLQPFPPGVLQPFPPGSSRSYLRT